jgi:hypothetical protein
MTSGIKQVFDYDSTLRVKSVTFPGVEFTILKPSIYRVAQMELLLAAMFSETGQLVKEAGELFAMAVANPATLDSDVIAQVQGLHKRISEEMQSGVGVTMVRCALKEISGLLIDGQPANVELLLTSGPPALVKEVLLTIESSVQDMKHSIHGTAPRKSWLQRLLPS